MPDAPNINRLWADLLVEALIRHGITQFCLAPGSRSTPLTTAIAAHLQARAVMHFDERGSAFFALGYGRATRTPAVWVTTSGTAVANGLPAVIEAAAEGVPLLMLTADRPPELRDTGANQAIDQVKLFGGYVRWQFDLPCPSPSIDPAFVLTTLDQAVYRTVQAPAGPVHLNFMLREPLAPTPTQALPPDYTASLASWYASDQPYTVYVPSTPAPDPQSCAIVAAQLNAAERGLLVVGRLDTVEEAEAVRVFAKALDWPVLPDVTSQLRVGASAPQVVAYYDQVLACEGFAEKHKPDVVLHIGGKSVSKRLMLYLQAARPSVYITVKNTPFRQDPMHHVTAHVQADPVAFCAAVRPLLRTHPNAAWNTAWLGADRRVAKVLKQHLGGGTLTEPDVARLVAGHLPDGHGLYLASSMPVRDVDAFAEPVGSRPRVAANRGASGIDGTIASAAGFATGLGQPVTLLIGDLALLHDLNSLALLRQVPVVVVAVNNDGGGIFSFLPIAQFEDVFEPYFGTPHGLTFEAAAQLFGLPYIQPETPADFLTAYQEACAVGTSVLIEVRTNREENRAFHESLRDYVLRSTF